MSLSHNVKSRGRRDDEPLKTLDEISGCVDECLSFPLINLAKKTILPCSRRAHTLVPSHQTTCIRPPTTD